MDFKCLRVQVECTTIYVLLRLEATWDEARNVVAHAVGREKWDIDLVAPINATRGVFPRERVDFEHDAYLVTKDPTSERWTKPSCENLPPFTASSEPVNLPPSLLQFVNRLRPENGVM